MVFHARRRLRSRSLVLDRRDESSPSRSNNRLGVRRHWVVVGALLIGKKKAAWIFVFAAGLAAEGWILHSHLSSLGEDLRASFQIEGPPTNLTVRYAFLNLGKQSALISTLGLFEIVGISPKTGPAKNIDLCDEVDAKTLMIVQFMGNIFRGSQIGDAGLNSAIYRPKEITVDGVSWQTKDPIAIESGKTRTISATFNLEPDHAKGYDTLVVCPIVGSLDIKNLSGAAICKGSSISTQLTSLLGTSTVSSTPVSRFAYCRIRSLLLPAQRCETTLFSVASSL
jgi:hypothetical protein